MYSAPLRVLTVALLALCLAPSAYAQDIALLSLPHDCTHYEEKGDVMISAYAAKFSSHGTSLP